MMNSLQDFYQPQRYTNKNRFSIDPFFDNHFRNVCKIAGKNLIPTKVHIQKLK